MFGASFPTRTRNHTISSAYRAILDDDGGERVFREFGLEAGKRYVSPFRNDAEKRNFSVFRSPKGHIRFKDFVSGDGGAFTALLSLYGYASFESQIRFAARLYNIDIKEIKEEPEIKETTREDGNRKPKTQSDRTTTTTPPKQTKRATTTTSAHKSYRVTQIELDDFTALERQTLAEISAGLITPPLLERFGIRALRSYSDEGKSQHGFAFGGKHDAAFTLVAPSANGNFYAYCYFQSDKNSPFPNKAKNFHLKLADYHDDVKFALGLRELRPNQTAYIVEGIKDCLILLAKGYNAFTLGGVQRRLHPNVLQRLRDNGNSLAILFDTDFAGVDAAQQLSASLKRPSLKNDNGNIFAPLSKGERGIIRHDASLRHCICTLPRLEQQTAKDAPKPMSNDLADYVCLYGFDELLQETLLSPAPLVSSNIANSATNVPAWKLSATSDKISNDAAALKTLGQLIQKSSRLVLRAPAGCGKTHAMLRHIAQRHFQKTGGVTVFAVPTVALAEQIKEEYHDLKPIVVTGNHSDMHRYYDQFETKISLGVAQHPKAQPLDTCVIVVVYDSIGRLADVIWKKNTLLCIDEMHLLVQDFDYRAYAMQQMSLAIEHAHKVVCLSATPELLFHDAPMNFTYCDIETPRKRPVSFSFREYDKRDEAVLAHMLALRESMQEQDKKRDIILLRVQSKSLLKRMRKLLVKHGVDENDIALLTNDTAKNNDSSRDAQEYRLIMETRHFSRNIILATGILDTGVNILNAGNVHVLMLDEKNENTIIQVANRFRNAENVHAHLFYTTKKQSVKQSNAKQTEQFHFFHTLASAQMLQEAMNQQTGRNDAANGVGRKSASRLFDTMLHFSDKTNRWRSCELAVMHQCAQIRLQTTSRDELAQRLEQEGFALITEQQPITSNPCPITVSSVAEEQRQELLQNEETVLRLLATKTRHFLAAMNAVSRSRSFKDKLPFVCPEALLSFIKHHEETAAMLAEHADLLREARAETLARYYCEACALGFDHDEAIDLVSKNRDPRKWRSFTQRLAMKQREEISLAGLTDSVLNKHDREKLRREEEIRRTIRQSAERGCRFTGSDGAERHIPNSLRSKKDLAERVNAYQSKLFRLTRQQAGELVDAMFHARYARERAKTDAGVRLSGYYAFEHTDNVLRRKTLAEYVTEYGVDGANYQQRFIERMREEAQSYERSLRRIAERNPFADNLAERNPFAAHTAERENLLCRK